MNQCHCVPPRDSSETVTVNIGDDFTWENFFGEVFSKFQKQRSVTTKEADDGKPEEAV